VALAVRMRPRRFYIFFPPPLVKRVRNGIEYGIGTIPLGGYVKIPGMHKPSTGDLESSFSRALEEAPWLEGHLAPAKAALDEGRLDDARATLPDLRGAAARANLSPPAQKSVERGLSDLTDALSGDAYWRAPVWKRVAVIVAGPGTNLLFAIALLTAVFMLGVPVNVSRTIAEVDSSLPAARFLQPGDRIVAVNGQAVQPIEIATKIRGSGGKPIEIAYLRDGDRHTFTAQPVQQDGAYRLGFTLSAIYERRGFPAAVSLATTRTWEVTKAIGESLGRIVTGKGREDVSSPVGIVRASSQTLEVGYREYLGVLALISLSLALLNLLPFLPLDGGHIAFSIIEGIRGRAMSREAYERASAVGIVLVLFLFFIGLSNDLSGSRGG
jgi:regulator of sigma E protease